MKVYEASLSGDLQGSLLKPAEPTGWGVVVLAGSSGRVDVARARLFAALGATSLALRWFGGEGQPRGICEVPLESFTPATDRLVGEGCDRVAYVGTSKGAEAALLLAIDDPRIRLVAAISPSSLVWANTGPGLDGAVRPQRSSWTRGGHPLRFVKYDETWQPEMREGLVTYRSLYERSLERGADDVPAATIPVERAQAGLVLVAGGDDALWPSDLFARSMAERLAAAGKSATLIHQPEAGHRVLFPGETTPRSTQHAHGGTDEADAELGRSAWHAISDVLRS
jgi:acetyl esterase/lipase